MLLMDKFFLESLTKQYNEKQEELSGYNRLKNTLTSVISYFNLRFRRLLLVFQTENQEKVVEAIEKIHVEVSGQSSKKELSDEEYQTIIQYLKDLSKQFRVRIILLTVKAVKDRQK